MINSKEGGEGGGGKGETCGMKRKKSRRKKENSAKSERLRQLILIAVQQCEMAQAGERASNTRGGLERLSTWAETHETSGELELGEAFIKSSLRIHH